MKKRICKDCSKPVTKKSERCQSCSKMGKRNPLFGIPKPFHIRKLLSSLKWGENNPKWVGDKVTKRALHAWVRRRLTEPTLCQECHLVPPLDLANISQKYKRDLDDWEFLCRKCHMTKDKRILNLQKGLNKK